MNRGLWTASVLLVIAGIGMILAGMFLSETHSRGKTAFRRVKARVVDLLRREEEGRFRSRYYPVIEYYAGGRLVKTVFEEGSYPSRWQVGDEIFIEYSARHPEKCRRAQEGFRFILPGILWGGGVFLVMLGITAFIRFAVRG